jgi:hypothetical protein
VLEYNGSCCEGHDAHDDGDQGRDDVSDMRWTMYAFKTVLNMID